jgi:putative ABC transport system substrate-binding protein
MFAVLCITACGPSEKEHGSDSVPIIAFIDFVEDATLAKAREGFLDALKSKGFSEDSATLRVIYRNAQGDQPSLLQVVDFVIAEKPVLIATNTTLATINTVQRTRDIPVFMMVAPRPDIAGLAKAGEAWPANLYGVYETLDYIDTSVTLIKKFFPTAKIVGTIYSQSESQSVDALERLRKGCEAMGITLEAVPVSNSSETQLITQSLLAKGVEVFFALPDNVIFSSFEAVVKACDEKKVPVITSEAGLVSRGALVSYGADLYQWGYQSGLQAAEFLRKGKLTGISPEIVKVRNQVINPEKATIFNVNSDSLSISGGI